MTEPKNWVIDANIILRAVLQDVPVQSEKVAFLMRQAEAGEIRLLIPEPVLSDVVYVLSGMKIPKSDIVKVVRDWLNLPGVALLGVAVDVLHTALDLFVEKNIKWSDALIAARMFEWGCLEICTFDHHFDRIEGIVRRQP